MKGICPFAIWRPTANFGYPQGTRGQNRPLFFVDHIMAGYKRTLDEAGWREPNGVGVHFGIGRDGSISQYTNIFDASWANGVSGSVGGYDRQNQHLAALERRPGAAWQTIYYVGTVAYALIAGGVNLPNTSSISTEHEGFPGDTWTAVMVESTIEVKRWCLSEMAAYGLPMPVVDADLLVRHAQIDSVNRRNCPGPNWPKDGILDALLQNEEEDWAVSFDKFKEYFDQYVIDQTGRSAEQIGIELGYVQRLGVQLFYQAGGDGKVYMRVGPGKIHIHDGSVFKAAGYKWEDVLSLPAGHWLLNLPTITITE